MVVERAGGLNFLAPLLMGQRGLAGHFVIELDRARFGAPVHHLHHRTIALQFVLRDDIGVEAEKSGFDRAASGRRLNLRGVTLFPIQRERPLPGDFQSGYLRRLQSDAFGRKRPGESDLDGLARVQGDTGAGAVPFEIDFGPGARQRFLPYCRGFVFSIFDQHEGRQTAVGRLPNPHDQPLGAIGQGENFFGFAAAVCPGFPR